jgi:molecular chaperone GrpE
MDPEIPATPEDTEEPTEIVDDSNAEVALLSDQLARARADYSNLEKRVVRDAGLERDRIRARVLENFLGVFEFARMAEVEAEKAPGPLAQGVSMLVREFERSLQSEGVETFGAPGDAFDGSMHDAVSTEEGSANEIVRVIAPGYKLGERVLRYAKVVVGA